MSPACITFWSPEYEEHMIPWRASAVNIGELCALSAAIRGFGSWRANCGYKPRFLLETLNTLRRPLVWLDVDARFLSPWALDLREYDFAAFFIPVARMRPQDLPFGEPLEGIASGTMFVNDTDAARAFLKAWIDDDDGRYDYEQMVLAEVWHRKRPEELRTFRLPQSYCKVRDVPWFVGEKGPAVIEHMQASRKLRRVADR